MVKINPPMISECEVKQDPDNEENVILIFEADRVPYCNGVLPSKVKVRIEFLESEGSLKNG